VIRVAEPDYNPTYGELLLNNRMIRRPVEQLAYLSPLMIGLAIGLATSAAVTRLIQSMLYQTRPLDPEIFSVVAVTLLVVPAARAIPAWRAAQLDPVAALRME